MKIQTGFKIVAVTLLLVFPLLLHATTSRVQEKSGDKSKVTEKKNQEECKLPKIRDELASRAAKDQAARRAAFESSSSKDSKSKIDTNRLKELRNIDKENTEWMKKQVAEHGWLGKSLVGKTGARNAWLLVQHADRNPKFQKKCLKLMEEMPEGEVAPVLLAYLTDRVLCAEGKPQVYGTQCSVVKGKAVLQKVKDRENLNKRREKVGLGPIEDYLKLMNSRFPQTNDSKKSKDKKVDDQKKKKNS